ncbi:NAD(P)/FAD-dependent oxidoreductase [Candidatus Paracaedibacter symbiosus]|uniref:NAD(P)/FAD-dependent oxidoreductase n=1 Tax=Candidatus Paracaedibacter symbiosus TaxID=244582 RepID=UPI000509CB68|nr:FAD-dependent oxidoreductase [Candidatus Paracaedibacter symbiosus]
MRNKYDVVIIGGGIFGTAMFYYLLKYTSKKALLLEKRRICSGATGSSGGFIRLLHSSLNLCDLSTKSFDEFNQFEKKIGMPCGLVKTGFFTIDSYKNLPAIEDHLQLIKNRGFQIECLTSREAARRFNCLEMPIDDDKVVIYEKDSGYADPIRTCKAYLSAGVSLGGDVLENVEVQSIVTKNGKVIGVKSSYSSFETPCAILAAGVGTYDFLKILGYKEPKFIKKIIQIGFYKYPLNNLPFPTFLDKTLGLYGRDYGDNRCLLGLTEESEQINDDQEPHLSMKVARKLTNVASKFAPWITAKCWIEGRCGIDAYTKNCEGIVEFLPEVKGLLVCSGGSGIGFKLAPEYAKYAISKIENY